MVKKYYLDYISDNTGYGTELSECKSWIAYKHHVMAKNIRKYGQSGPHHAQMFMAQGSKFE